MLANVSRRVRSPPLAFLPPPTRTLYYCSSATRTASRSHKHSNPIMPTARRSFFSIAATAVIVLVAATSVSATYFTSPTSTTVWASAAGQQITWKFQPGGAPQGDIVLEAVALGGRPL